MAVRKACEECCRNCQLMHYDRMDLSPSVIRFFRVLVGKDFSQVLLLPHKFADTVRHLVDQETRLEDSDGMRCTVTLSCVKNSLAFTRGWPEFALNHNLKVGDFLIFNYIKGAHFVVHIYGKSCIEILDFDKNGLLCKRAQTRGNISAVGKPCEKTDINAGTYIQPTTNSHPNSDGGNGKWSCLDSSFDMMIERDAGLCPGEERMCFDLSCFEMQEDKQVSDIEKGIDAVQGTSNPSQISMTSPGEADKDPVVMDPSTKETEIGMIGNDYNLEPKDDTLFECAPLADLSNSLLMGISCAELGKKGTSIQSQKSMRSQDEADKDPMGTKDLIMDTCTKKTTEIGIIVNDYNLEPKDDSLLECSPSADLPNSFPIGLSCAELGKQGTSVQSQTSMRSQDEADKNPMGTKELNMDASTKKTTEIGMIVNDYNLEPKDDSLLECGPSADLSNSLPVVISCADLGKKGTSIESQTSMRSGGEADKDPMGTKDLNMNASTKKATDIDIIVNDYNLEARDDTFLECGPSADLPNSFPMVLSCAELGKKGTSVQSQTSMRSQGEGDKDPMGSKDLNMDASTKKTTEIDMIVNDNNLEPKDDALLECGPLADLLTILPMGLSCAEHGKKSDNMSNMRIQLQNARRSNGNYDKDWSSPLAEEGACFIDIRQEFTGDIKKRMKEELDTTEEAHHHVKRLRGLEPPTVKESGISPLGPRLRRRPVKLEPVDDMPSSVLHTLTCLAVTDGRTYLRLPTKLPEITCRKGTLESKAIMLHDQERRFWPALYYHKSGLHVLTTRWAKFNEENRIQAGDHYVFQVEDLSQGIYKVDVLHQ